MGSIAMDATAIIRPKAAGVPNSHAANHSTAASASTSIGITKTPLAMPPTSALREAVWISSASSLSEYLLISPALWSFWTTAGAAFQRRANALPDSDTHRHSTTRGHTQRRASMAAPIPSIGSTSTRAG
jgi:hypothetical protein